MPSRSQIFLFGLVGWILFAISIWYHHKPAGSETVSPATEKALEIAGFSETKVSTLPPPRVIRETVEIPGAERLVYVNVETKPTESSAPEVRFVEKNCLEPASPQEPNWKLRPGDLGLRDTTLDLRRAGRRAFVTFKGTLLAVTPSGVVERYVEPTADAWVSTKALGLPPRFGPTIRASSLPSVEAGFYWTRQRVAYEATLGRDLDRGKWYVAGGARW